MESNIREKMAHSIKWTGFAEVVSKLIQPISNIFLARLLTPEAFGVIATVNIILSFAELITDAGFQKFIIQHDFKGEEDLKETITVAFWSNLALSFVLWESIVIARDQLATLVGNPGLGHVIAISCIVLPLTSFSSLQIGYLRRKFQFKTLFKARILTVAIPVLITIPLAFLFRSYWAMVIGSIMQALISTIYLTIACEWKPKLFFSFEILKKMFSFSAWTFVEQFSIWMTTYIGTFIVSTYLTLHELGLYKTGMMTVNQILSIVTGATIPVLFSGLSRLQNDQKQFVHTFLQFQRVVALFILPMSVGIFIYRQFVTDILLGKQWGETVGFIGLWALISGVTIVFAYYASEVYRSLGKPKLSVISQILHLVVLVPVLLIAAPSGFEVLYRARSLVRLQAIVVDLIILWFVLKITPRQMIKNIWRYAFASVIMAGGALLLNPYRFGIIWTLFTILVSILLYFFVVCLHREDKAVVMKLLATVRKSLNF